MQHSPQEIKTKLGEAVDPEGNVLNMAAVVEVIGLLERTPLTKEALEQTRIGRTVNLLRKKTENEDIARRAKKLVKRWQKLVQNHLEAVRNTNSPLNGLRCSSPIVNGLTKDEENTVVDRKNKGTKRKRSSSETPPPGGGHLEEISEVQMKLVAKEEKPEIDIPQDSSLVSGKSTFESEENTNEKDVSLDCTGNYGATLSKRLKTVNDDETVCGCEQKQTKTDESRIENTSNCCTSSYQERTENLNHDDVRWEGKDFSQQTEDLIESDNAKGEHDTSTLPLDTEDQANGINGRFGEDGNWYAWNQTMPCNEGNLIILPYVLLE